jgi:hypothetical protein
VPSESVTPAQAPQHHHNRYLQHNRTTAASIMEMGELHCIWKRIVEFLSHTVPKISECRKKEKVYYNPDFHGLWTKIALI